MRSSLRIRFDRPGTDEWGEMTFSGESEFIKNAVPAVSYVVSWLGATYGADPENWARAGNELMAAWDAAKRGESYEGEIVSIDLIP